MTDITLTRWGTNIREHRLRIGYTQQQVADTLGIDQAAVSRWEAGITEPMRTHKTELINLFGCGAEDLFPL